jgi:RES domain-containing protein
MNLYQAFNQNPVNFVDPFGTIIKTEDLYELKRISESQGPDAAKRWIDRNPNFTGGEKLDLHMKVWFGFDDLNAEVEINYIPVWDEFWAFIDETAYQMSKPYLKFHAGVKHRRFDIAAEGLGEIAVIGGTGGFLGHYIPEGVAALCEKFPFLNKNISSLIKEGTKDVRHAVQSPGAAQSVIDGINPKYFNPDTRFGRAFYVAEEGGTAVAEVTSHGGNVSNVIRFKINLRNQKVLDLTKSSIATKWGYNPNLSYKLTKKIAEKALKEGYKIIAFPSTQGSGTNYAILSNFEKILKSLMVTPVGK